MHLARRPLRLALVAVVALLSLPTVARADSSAQDMSYGGSGNPGFANPWPGGSYAGTKDFSSTLDSQSRLTVGGTTVFNNGSYNTTEAMLSRFLPSGQLDTNFGSGGEWAPTVQSQVPGIAATPNGSTIVASSQFTGNYWSPAVWCVSSLGVACPGFTSGNVLPLQYGLPSVGVVPAANPTLGSDIYIAASLPAGGIGVERLNANGALALSYGSTGTGTIALAGTGTPAMVVYPDGSLVVSDGGSSGAVLYRITPAGGLDTRWGSNGSVAISSGSKGYDGSALAPLPTGEVVAAVDEATGTVDGYTVARLSPLGQPETYGVGGQVTVAVTSGAPGTYATLNNMVARPDGGVLVAGTVGTTQPVVVSLGPAGTLDTSFNGTGVKAITGLYAGSVALPSGSTQPLLVGNSTLHIGSFDYHGASAMRLTGNSAWGTPMEIPSLFGGTTNGVNSMVQDPVNAVTGNVYAHAQDIELAGRGPTALWLRSYNSQDAQPGAYGYGWTGDFNVSLTKNPSGTVTERDAGGAQLTFVLAAPPFFPTGIPPVGVRDWVAFNSTTNTYTLTKPDGAKWTFNSSGKLTAITDTNGQALTLAYTGTNLHTITNASGRVLTLTYTGAFLTGLSDGTRSVGSPTTATETSRQSPTQTARSRPTSTTTASSHAHPHAWQRRGPG